MKIILNKMGIHAASVGLSMITVALFLMLIHALYVALIPVEAFNVGDYFKTITPSWGMNGVAVGFAFTVFGLVIYGITKMNTNSKAKPDVQVDTQMLDLSTSYAKGENKYILGKTGTGKTIFIYGIIVNSLGLHSMDRAAKYTNVVVVDCGHSYEGLSNILADSQFIEFQPISNSELAPVTVSNKSLSVFELEGLKRFQENPFTSEIIDTLKQLATKDTLLIIEEWWAMPLQLKQWALTEFEGETLVSIMTEEDITVDGAFHLFDGGTELSKLGIKR